MPRDRLAPTAGAGLGGPRAGAGPPFPPRRLRGSRPREALPAPAAAPRAGVPAAALGTVASRPGRPQPVPPGWAPSAAIITA